MSLQNPVLALSFCLFLMSLTSCAGGAYRKAQEEDTVQAYHRFLRDHGDSSYGDDARARLAFARVRDRPSRKAYEAFAKKFAGSDLVHELRPFVEEHFLRSARAAGSAEAYRQFLVDFPSGALAARAEGNAVYLEADGYQGDPDALARFAERHPESDYAAEALRSVAALRARQEGAVRSAELLVDIADSVPGADRLRRTFVERAVKAYAGVGVRLVPIAADDPGGSEPLRVTIAHSEDSVKSKLTAGTVSQHGILVQTTVSLQLRGQADPIWQRTFEHRGGASERSETTSLLFSAGGSAYWQKFFVPVATWDTARTVRQPRTFREPAVAVELVGTRAVVAFGDGDFQVFDVSDPASPAVLAEFERPRDLSEFDGVRVVGNRVVIFGVDGIEVVRLDPDGPVRETAQGRDIVGSIVAVEALGGGLVLAGNRGLVYLNNDGSTQKLLDREVLGLARSQGRLLFTDGQSLFATTLPLLKSGRVEAELRMGRGFRPARLRATGSQVVVIGDRGTAWVDARTQGRLRLVSRIESLEAGDVGDAVMLGGHLFLLGARGLQVSDSSGERLIDSIDVDSRVKLSGDGRHLALVGEGGLQMVDATPFVSALPAAVAPAP